MRTIFVCSIGGHLTQLHAMMSRFAEVDPDKALWVTHESAQSRSLLAGHDVEFVPYIEERDVAGVARAFRPAATRIREYDADLVVSTGSAIAGAWLPAAARLGRGSVFIESAAMVNGRTRTGKLLQLFPGVRLYTQSAAMANKRWDHCGSVFEGFTAHRIDRPSSLRRVVVTVGTSREFGFRNLVERLIPLLDDVPEVLWQTGATDVTGLPIAATPWLPADQLGVAMRDADLVISHAGAGSALAALLAGKRPVLVPRRAARGEFRDDHQLQVAEMLASSGVAAHIGLGALSRTRLLSAAGWRVEPTPDRSPIWLLNTDETATLPLPAMSGFGEQPAQAG